MNKWEFFGKWLVRVILAVIGIAGIRFEDGGPVQLVGIGLMWFAVTLWTEDKVKWGN